MTEDTSTENIHARAINFLIEGGEIEEAALLVSCKLEIEKIDTQYATQHMKFILSGIRAVYEAFNSEEVNSPGKKILKAFNAVLPPYQFCATVIVTLDYPNFGANWRQKLIDAIQNRRALNQCVPIDGKQTYEWQGLYFRSPVELMIAKELDKHNLLFLPNCMARLGNENNRVRREADFLVCDDGKWGILEIDGAAFHTSAAKDHDRDRLFKHHGIILCEHYEAKRCMNSPQEVVEDFLRLMKKTRSNNP